MEQDDPSYFLAPISEDDANEYLLTATAGPSFGNVGFLDRPQTPFQHRFDNGFNGDPEHIDAIFNNVPRYRTLAPAPPLNTLRHASVGGEEFHLEDFDRYEWAGEVARLHSAGIDLPGPSGSPPAKTATQLHIRLQARFRKSAGLLPLPEGTLMDASGLYPAMPLTRSSSSESNFIGNLKRPAPIYEADYRPTSPKRPKHQ